MKYNRTRSVLHVLELPPHAERINGPRARGQGLTSVSSRKRFAPSQIMSIIYFYFPNKKAPYGAFLFICAQGESRTHGTQWAFDLQSTPALYGTTCAFELIIPLYVLAVCWFNLLKKPCNIFTFCQI